MLILHQLKDPATCQPDGMGKLETKWKAYKVQTPKKRFRLFLVLGSSCSSSIIHYLPITTTTCPFPSIRSCIVVIA